MMIAADAAACQLVQLAQWPVRPSHYLPVVEGTINGKKAGILLDTGAALSIIHSSEVRRLELTPISLRGQRIFGIGGESRVAGVYIDELKIGDAARKDWLAIVTGDRPLGGGIALILGYDFFHQTEIEFDLPHNVVRLFLAKGCERASLAYWTKDAGEVALESSAVIELPVAIDGKPLQAQLDSGASVSTLARISATDLGATEQSAGVVPGGCTVGIGGAAIDSWIAPFKSFAIGSELVRNPKLRFADLWKHMKTEETGSSIPRRIGRQPDMLLGADFLRAHRVFISHSQRKMYFSYVGGTVFSGTPGRPCPRSG